MLATLQPPSLVSAQRATGARRIPPYFSASTTSGLEYRDLPSRSQGTESFARPAQLASRLRAPPVFAIQLPMGQTRNSVPAEIADKAPARQTAPSMFSDSYEFAVQATLTAISLARRSRVCRLYRLCVPYESSMYLTLRSNRPDNAFGPEMPVVAARRIVPIVAKARDTPARSALKCALVTIAYCSCAFARCPMERRAETSDLASCRFTNPAWGELLAER